MRTHAASFAAAALLLLCGLPARGQDTTPASDLSTEVAAQAPVAADRRILVMLDMVPEHYRPSSDYGAASGYGDPASRAARRRFAARLAHDNGLSLVEDWPMPVLGVDCMVMDVPGDEPLERVARRIAQQRGVAWSQPLNQFHAQEGAAPAPNDRLFGAQPAAHRWRLADLQRMATGRGIKVAIVDSMIDVAHPDLRGRVNDNRNLIGNPANPEQHGTGIAGVIGARADNGIGIVGIAPEATLIGLRACRQRSPGVTLCDSLSLARAMTAALDANAQIINLSLSGPEDTLLARLVAVAIRRGVSVVAAVDPASGTGFPASLPGVFAVASEGLAPTSARVYTAPGRDVPTTGPGGGWFLASGSSYAAAHVSGLIALERQLTRGRAVRLVSTGASGGEIDAYRTLLQAGGARVTR